VPENSESVGGVLFEAWEIIVKIVTVVKFGVDDGGGSGRGCFEVKVRMDRTKLTNVIIAGLTENLDLIRKGKMFRQR